MRRKPVLPPPRQSHPGLWGSRITPKSAASTAPAREDNANGFPGYRTLLETIVFYIAGLAVATRLPGAGGGLGERSRLYIVCLAVATWPLARNFRTELVRHLHDPLQHPRPIPIGPVATQGGHILPRSFLQARE